MMRFVLISAGEVDVVLKRVERPAPEVVTLYGPGYRVDVVLKPGESVELKHVKGKAPHVNVGGPYVEMTAEAFFASLPGNFNYQARPNWTRVPT